VKGYLKGRGGEKRKRKLIKGYKRDVLKEKGGLFE